MTFLKKFNGLRKIRLWVIFGHFGTKPPEIEKKTFCLRIDQYWYEVKAPVLESESPKVPGGHAFGLRVVAMTNRGFLANMLLF